MDFRTSGHGRSLYWLTAPVTLNGQAHGLFMLDTGADVTVTTLKCGSSHLNPRTLHFGSGSVTGYPQRVIVPIPARAGVTDLRGEIVHDALDFPFDDEVQGILGLLPDPKGEGLITYPRIKNVELDFRTNSLYFNRDESPYGRHPRLSGTFRHPTMPEKPWLRGQIAIVDASTGQRRELPSDRRWLMLDTGATTAVSFLTRNFDPLPCDPEGRDIQAVDIRLVGSGPDEWVRCPVPVRTLWPSCIDVDADDEGVVVLGIQLLYYPFRSLRYRVGPEPGQVSDVSLF